MKPISVVEGAVAELAPAFSGQLLLPTHPAYEEARKVHNALVDKRPALIARCSGVVDVVDARHLAPSWGSKWPFAVAVTTLLGVRRSIAGR